MLGDITFGSLSSRELTMRPLRPLSACKYGPDGLAFSWVNALKPLNIWRAIFSRDHWSFWVKRFSGCNHRCYCDGGTTIDGRIEIAGYGFHFWYSHYVGELPCPCDEALEEFRNEE